MTDLDTQTSLSPADLPLILAGPIVRRVTTASFALWLVASRELSCRLNLSAGDTILFDSELQAPELEILPVGQRAIVHCIEVKPHGLPADGIIHYDLQIEAEGRWQSLSERVPGLLYGDALPRIPVSVRLREILHGSCRKPHHPSPDAMVAADGLLAERYATNASPPDLLMLSGDQIYADDLCGPMLLAVHQAIRLLGMANESFPDAEIADADALYHAPDTLYGRRRYLPKVLAKRRYSRLFMKSSRPVFTSSACDNHLISFGETFALYLLSWSPALWELIDLPESDALSLNPEKSALYAKEKVHLEAFVAGLPRVRRLMAHLPTYMIFDDHDVTDDWNLTAEWEQIAYGHAFSRRIIGNALMAYWLCQGWGNAPEAFDANFWSRARDYCLNPGSETQEAWIQQLYACKSWHYHLPTYPKLVVLDTRTRRWHAANLTRPSGLMSWEALREMQQWLIHEQAVVLVSAAPIFGLKFIEVLQSLFARAGQALAVDAENWMAHAGAANTLMNIFRRVRSPAHFVILSGDVHYSFAYDILLRFRRHSPKIWQITASGLKNEFPARALIRLDRLNRLLFHEHSPLNWLTRRKGMRIEPRLANGLAGAELVNQSGIGIVTLDTSGAPSGIQLLTGTDEIISFEPRPH